MVQITEKARHSERAIDTRDRGEAKTTKRDRKEEHVRVGRKGNGQVRKHNPSDIGFEQGRVVKSQRLERKTSTKLGDEALGD